MSKELLLATLSRALRYKASSLQALQRISDNCCKLNVRTCGGTAALTQDYEHEKRFGPAGFPRKWTVRLA